MDVDIQYRTDSSGQSVISLSGAFDLVTRDLVLHAARNAVDNGDGGEVILDLSGVTFVDSTGLGVLVRLDNYAKERQKRIIIRDPSARVSRVLELTALDSALTVHTST